ncbi:hypothetical protein [Mycobacterium bourgelatii]|uniref:Transposase n=1 Tax=Mycobacterium bourgelatii TaxID=1273442 RepID=A0A7I9YSD4_MYCBU|nr:hypothetical protein [Mycobacterium bourgelatii]MCV6974486.1 hypothetical protein [Mycobacterium bourgelatii]GFG91442.1 hypothetical protein MBOU_34840 [Mycobacterium bourgelatii]
MSRTWLARCWPVQSGLTLRPVTKLADGSCLSVLPTTSERQRIRRHQARGLSTVPQGPVVRVIDYDVADRDTDNRSPIRLITTIVDPERVSAAELAAAYHQRWEFESILAENKPANAAVTGCCLHTAPTWCARRFGHCSYPLRDPRPDV